VRLRHEWENVLRAVESAIMKGSVKSTSLDKAFGWYTYDIDLLREAEKQRQDE